MIPPQHADTPSGDPGREMRWGGATLLAGSLVFLITIGLELAVGWTMPGSETPLAETASFMQGHWTALSWIWGGQMFGALLFASGAFILLGSRHLREQWHPAGVLWSIAATGGVMLTVAYGLTLGSYPPALAGFEQSPELLATARGAVRGVYIPGLLAAWLGYLIVLIREGVVKGGMVPRSWLLALAVVVIAAIAAAASGLLDPSTAGAVIFVIPGLLGLAIWKAGRRLPRDAS